MKNKTLAIVPAGGSGKRMAAGQRKQYLPLAGVPILIHTLRALEKAPVIDEIYLVLPEHDLSFALDTASRYQLAKLTRVLAGGNHRQDSVRNGLSAAGEEHEIIVIHDGVRPFVSVELLEQTVQAARQEGAAITALPVKETVKTLDSDGMISTLERADLWLAQTPQAFKLDIIKKAHEEAGEKGYLATDDAALVERMGLKVKIIHGSYNNIKITTKEDLQFGEFLAARGI